MNLNELYTSILKVAALSVTSDGYLNVAISKDKRPYTIKGKRVALPTPERLSDLNFEDRIIFHPLNENILRGESEVLGEYRKCLNIRFNYVIGLLMRELLVIATSPDEHAKLTPDQSVFLECVKSLDKQKDGENIISLFDKLLEAMPVGQSQKAFVSIFVRRGGVVAGEQYGRIAVTSFPLYSELIKPGKLPIDVFGVKIDKAKYRDSITNLMEYIFPDIDKAEAYNAGTNIKIAPFLDVLMKSVLGLASRINDVVEVFRSYLGDELADELSFDSEWVETFQNLGAFNKEINSVPPQAGNEGSTAAKTSVSTPPNQPAGFTPSFVPTATPAPVPANGWSNPTTTFQQPQQQAATDSDTVDFSTIARTVPQVAQLVGHHQWVNHQSNQPQRASLSNPVGNTSSWNNQNNWSGNSNYNQPRFGSI